MRDRHGSEQPEEAPAIEIVAKDQLPPISARGHVIDAIVELEARSSCHRLPP
jgi:hypothetical protein